MKDGNEPQNTMSLRPQNQTGERYGTIKGRQRTEDDFKGHGDMPRGSEPESGAAARRR
ncbi:hypothetical protein [Altererythrobacter sp. Root672]|uniref:hypothetical protein n=1 Tax=Altererythrobacter sp. Root672 TaxID=1736584 RepID=UPI000AE432C1|nr:hypothetical protein [Altererythrobacter sp. Root672]